MELVGTRGICPVSSNEVLEVECACESDRGGELVRGDDLEKGEGVARLRLLLLERSFSCSIVSRVNDEIYKGANTSFTKVSYAMRSPGFDL